MRNFVGIDVGTSFIKGALIDLDLPQLRDTAQVPFPDFVPGTPVSHREVYPGAVVSAVEQLLTRLMPDLSGCDGVVLCGQMHGFVLVNGRGEPVSNYISWLDGRVSADEFAGTAELISQSERSEVGNEFGPGITSSLLYWLNRRGLLPAGVTPVSLADFVTGRLCGTMPLMEPTQAAAFGAMRLSTLNWHCEVIGKLGLHLLKWPDVRPIGTPVGTWHGVPCFVSVGDQQCALVGALLREREVSVNIGTGSQVAIIARTASCGSEQVRPYFDGRFLRTITHIPGGRTLSALIGLLTELGGLSENEAWPRIEAAIRLVQSTDVRASLAFFPGPCGASGFLENLHEGNVTVGHIFHAAFESMAENFRACARRLDPESDSERVVFSGGVARRLELLRNLTAAALHLPARLSPHPDDTLYGLMVLAVVCSGRQPGVQAATETAAAAPRDSTTA